MLLEVCVFVPANRAPGLPIWDAISQCLHVQSIVSDHIELKLSKRMTLDTFECKRLIIE